MSSLSELSRRYWRPFWEDAEPGSYGNLSEIFRQKTGHNLHQKSSRRNQATMEKTTSANRRERALAATSLQWRQKSKSLLAKSFNRRTPYSELNIIWKMIIIPYIICLKTPVTGNNFVIDKKWHLREYVIKGAYQLHWKRFGHNSFPYGYIVTDLKLYMFTIIFVVLRCMEESLWLVGSQRKDAHKISVFWSAGESNEARDGWAEGESYCHHAFNTSKITLVEMPMHFS